jgi:putative transcriptional regulator
MIRCHLSLKMGEKRVRLIDVARATGISRNMLSRMHYDRAQRIDLQDVDKLCLYFGYGIDGLLEFVPFEQRKRSEKGRKAARWRLRR